MASELNEDWPTEIVLMEAPHEEPTHRDHAVFFTAIHERVHVSLTWNSESRGGVVTDVFLPWDFAPMRGARDQQFRHWFFDSVDWHPFPVTVDNVVSIEIDGEPFEPWHFVSGPIEWSIKRDWWSHEGG